MIQEMRQWILKTIHFVNISNIQSKLCIFCFFLTKENQFFFDCLKQVCLLWQFYKTWTNSNIWSSNVCKCKRHDCKIQPAIFQISSSCNHINLSLNYGTWSVYSEDNTAGKSQLASSSQSRFPTNISNIRPQCRAVANYYLYHLKLHIFN